MDRRRFVKLGSIGAALFAMNNSVFAQRNNSQPSIYGRNANIKPITLEPMVLILEENIIFILFPPTIN